MTPGWLLLIAGGGLVAGILSAFKSPRVWLVSTLAGAIAAFAAAVEIEKAWRRDLSIPRAPEETR